MDLRTIAILADSSEASDSHIALLNSAGYAVNLPEDLTRPVAASLLLVDITQLRGNPFSALHTQRQLGSDSPAILLASRMTNEMGEELFSLGIRDFIRKPVDDTTLLNKLEAFFTVIEQEHSVEQLRNELESTQASMARRLEELSALSRIGRAITSLTDIDTVLARILEAAVFLTHADEGVVYLRDNTTNTLTLRAHHGVAEQNLPMIQSPSADSDASVVFSSGKSVTKGDNSPALKITTGYTVHASVNVPIMLNRQVVGVLAVHNHSMQIFDTSDQAVLESLADYVAIALDRNAQADNAQAQLDSILDLPNTVKWHAETLFDPVDGIESQVAVLLSGGFDPLTEKQHTAVTRIKSASERLIEIIGFIRESLNEFDA